MLKCPETISEVLLMAADYRTFSWNMKEEISAARNLAHSLVDEEHPGLGHDEMIRVLEQRVRFGLEMSE